MKFYILAVSALIGLVNAQGPPLPPAPKKYQQYTTPVPILKQIDRHNDDGSYSYGYENADGTYKIETKYATGEVYGKYGYIDDTGALREVEYGASKSGFAPAGNDIKVPPPTINTDPNNLRPLGPDEEDDGQYREDPSIYYKNDPNNIDPPQSDYPGIQFNQNTYAPTFPTAQPYRPAPAYTPPMPQAYTPPTPQPAYNNYWNAAQQYTKNNWQQQNWNQNNNFNRNYWNPSPPGHPGYNIFAGHPANNIDIWTGSYTVQYR